MDCALFEDLHPGEELGKQARTLESHIFPPFPLHLHGRQGGLGRKGTKWGRCVQVLGGQNGGPQILINSSQFSVSVCVCVWGGAGGGG